jgi:hypothetical protein
MAAKDDPETIARGTTQQQANGQDLSKNDQAVSEAALHAARKDELID